MRIKVRPTDTPQRDNCPGAELVAVDSGMAEGDWTGLFNDGGLEGALTEGGEEGFSVGEEGFSVGGEGFSVGGGVAYGLSGKKGTVRIRGVNVMCGGALLGGTLIRGEFSGINSCGTA